MRITTSKLRQIIREVLTQENVASSGAADSTRVTAGSVYQIDASGKMIKPGDSSPGSLSAQFTVEGLAEAELTAMKKKYAIDDDAKFYFTLENRSGKPVFVFARGLGKNSSDSDLKGKIEPSASSIGFYPINSTEIGSPDIKQQIVVSSNDIDISQMSEPFRMNFGSVAEAAKNLVSGEDAYPAALIKLVIGAGKEPTTGDKNAEQTVAATKNETKKDAVMRLQKVIGMLDDDQDGVWREKTQTAWKEFINTNLWSDSVPNTTGVSKNTIITNWSSAAEKLGYKPNVFGAADFAEKVKQGSEPSATNETVLRWNKLAGLLKG
jgi:hypothetical protein